MPKKLKKVAIKALKVIIPLALLYYIFTIIDFNELQNVLLTSNLKLILIAILSVPLQYLLFTTRWAILQKLISGLWIKFKHLHSILYKGLFVGFFVPGGVGVDLFRIIQIKQKHNTYSQTISIIFLEKIFGVIASILLILITYPFITIKENSALQKVVLWGGITCVCVLACLLAVQLLRKKEHSLIHRFYRQIINAFSFRVSKILKRVLKNNEESANEEVINNAIKNIINPKFIVIVILFSFAILITRASFLNLVFNAFGYKIPLVANLFVVPLINILAMIPISLGGIGVRETGYIVLYGLFGVPAEGSLIVSLITFTYLLLNISSGGLLFILDNFKRKDKE